MAEAQAPKPDRPKCLLVDDLEENLVALEAVLSDEPMQLFRARSGVEALELLLEHEFALALVDVQMPEMNGFELAEIMRSTGATKAIPIIFITAGAHDPGRIFQGYEAGAVDFLVKPLDAFVVQSKVRAFLELYHQRRQLEEKLELLRQTQALQTKLLESSQDCIMLLDLDANLLSVSPGGLAALELTDSRPYIGRPWLAFWGDRDEAPLAEAIQHARHGGAGKLTSFRPTFDDTPKWWDLIITPVRDAMGQPERLLCVARDVTELKHTQADLERALRVRDDFLSIASHELRTPLTPLKLQIDILRRVAARTGFADLPKEKLEQMLETSDRQVNQLRELIEDLLDISRIASGRFSIKPSPTDLSKLVLDVVEQFREQLDEANCAVVTDIEPDLVGGWDRHRIEQVVTNLISNACKYASGSDVMVKTRKAGDVAELVVHDRGMGIPSEKLPHIFDRFERVESGPSVGGLGLGLYIAREITSMHGGNIRVESALNEYSRFTVQLPLSRDDECPSQRLSAEESQCLDQKPS